MHTTEIDGVQIASPASHWILTSGRSQEETNGSATQTTTPSVPTHMFRAPYRPMLDPLPLHNWWYGLLFPIAILTAIAYKSVRSRSLESFYKEVVMFAGQIVIGMIGLGIAAWIVLGVILPRIAPMPGI